VSGSHGMPGKQGNAHREGYTSSGSSSERRPQRRVMRRLEKNRFILEGRKIGGKVVQIGHAGFEVEGGTGTQEKHQSRIACFFQKRQHGGKSTPQARGGKGDREGNDAQTAGGGGKQVDETARAGS